MPLETCVELKRRRAHISLSSAHTPPDTQLICVYVHMCAPTAKTTYLVFLNDKCSQVSLSLNQRNNQAQPNELKCIPQR